jgi:hypothetical protein
MTKKDFFISYTSADEPWAEWIAWQLMEAGYSTVLQKWDFHAGANFIMEMHKATIKAKRTIAALSQGYLKALFTNPEWASAMVQDPMGDKRRLIPVRVENFKPEGLFKALIYIDIVGLSEPEAQAKLLDGIKNSIQGGSRPPANKPLFPGT